MPNIVTEYMYKFIAETYFSGQALITLRPYHRIIILFSIVTTVTFLHHTWTTLAMKTFAGELVPLTFLNHK